MTETKEAVGAVANNGAEYSETDTFAAEVIAQELDGAEDSPKVRLDVKLLGRHKQPWRPEKGVVAFDEADQVEKSIFLTIDPNKGQSFEYSRKDLRKLGFAGTDYSKLVPDTNNRIGFSLIGKTVGVKPRVVSAGERTRTYWNLAISDAPRPAVTRDHLRKFMSENAEAYAAVEQAEQQDAPY